MSKKSDVIEQFILDTLGESEEMSISRNELAQYFNCAPSQINYVLMTRFSVDRGFTIYSQRGGGGFVSIMRLGNSQYLNDLVKHSISDSLTFARACQILDRLASDEKITPKEHQLIKSMMTDKAILSPHSNTRDFIRAAMFKSLLLQLLCL